MHTTNPVVAAVAARAIEGATMAAMATMAAVPAIAEPRLSSQQKLHHSCLNSLMGASHLADASGVTHDFHVHVARNFRTRAGTTEPGGRCHHLE